MAKYWPHSMSSGPEPASSGSCFKVGCLPVTNRSISTLRAGMRSENLASSSFHSRCPEWAMARTIATWSSGGMGNMRGDQRFRTLGVGLDHPGQREADVDAGRLHVAEQAEPADGMHQRGDLLGSRLRAVAVDPAQDSAPALRTHPSWQEARPIPRLRQTRGAARAPAPSPRRERMTFPVWQPRPSAQTKVRAWRICGGAGCSRNYRGNEG